MKRGQACKQIPESAFKLNVVRVRRNVVNLDWLNMKGKIISLSAVAPLVKSLRANGVRRIVFTNGCFDILHVGHTRYLTRARALGDVLLVAINSDRSTREIKGSTRPVVPEDERAEMLAALACVDYVTIFDDVSPRTLIAEILPDVLVKGGDYKLNEIHGRDEVERAGGRVVALPFIEGQSTTSIIEKVKKAVNRES